MGSDSIKTNPGNTENLQSIQMLRGMAAFLVLLNHAITDHYLPAGNFFRRFSENGWMGVEIFFIISGFIIPFSMFNKNYKISDFKVFFFKRVVRIEPPYIISIVLVLFLGWATTHLPSYTGPAFHLDLGNVIGHLGYLNAFTNQPWLNLAYWTLAIEFEYYILIALIFPLINHRKRVVMFGTYFALLLCTFIVFPHNDRHIPVYFPFFLIGIALFLFKCNKVSLIEFLVMITSCLAVCYFFYTPVLLFVSVAAILCIRFIKRAPKALLFLGTVSYSLYLTHSVLVTRFMALLAKFDTRLHIGIQLILCLCFCVFFAWIYHLIFEKPFHKLSRKIRYSHKEMPAKEVDDVMIKGIEVS